MQEEFLIAARKYFSEDYRGIVHWQRFYSVDLPHIVAAEMAKTSLPTTTAAHLVFERLVREGVIVRTDGKDGDDDAKEAVDRAQKNLDAEITKAAASPLTRDEIEHFASLSQFELSELFWGPLHDGYTRFAVRYSKAMAEHGFREPQRLQQTVESTEDDDPNAVKLTAEEYNGMRANDICLKLRDPRWRLAVEKLIKAGKI